MHSLAQLLSSAVNHGVILRRMQGRRQTWEGKQIASSWWQSYIRMGHTVFLRHKEQRQQRQATGQTGCVGVDKAVW